MQGDVRDERVRWCKVPSPVGIPSRCIETCLVRDACNESGILVSVELGKGPKLETCHDRSMYELESSRPLGKSQKSSADSS